MGKTERYHDNYHDGGSSWHSGTKCLHLPLESVRIKRRSICEVRFVVNFSISKEKRVHSGQKESLLQNIVARESVMCLKNSTYFIIWEKNK